jgi:hypothetical protein
MATEADEAYEFVMVRSGDGETAVVGRGTLAEGTALIAEMDRAYEAWEAGGFEGANPVHEFYEGCDIYAQRNGEPAFIYTDGWEPC